MGGRTIDQPPFQVRPPSSLFTDEWTKKMAITVIRRRIAEFLTKIERKKCNNTQNMVIDGCYLLFEEYLQEKKNDLFISWIRAEK